MRARQVVGWSAVILAVTLACPALAQGPSIAPGQRLRVTAADPGRFAGVAVGSVVKVGPDSLTLFDADHGAALDLPLNSITRIEVGHRHRHTRQGFLIGLAIGAAAGALVASGTGGCGAYGEPYVECNYTGGEKAALVVIPAAFWGGIGAWLGHRKQSDDWTDAPVERLKLSVLPERTGGRVAFTLSF